MKPVSRPRLSIVIGCRNDNHGGGMISRLQHSIDCFFSQVHGVRSKQFELVLVEWNPPSENPPLKSVLDLSGQPENLSIKIVQVPAQIHQRIPFADQMPLYQYISKNVGIRRASGEYILSTNLDILLSNPLFSVLANDDLAHDAVFRADRVDVQSALPPDKSDEAKLSYCSRHALRAFRPWGIFEGPEASSAIPPSDFSAHRQVGGKPFTRSRIKRAADEWLASTSSLIREIPKVLKEFKNSPRRTALSEGFYRLALKAPLAQAFFLHWRYPQLHTGASGDFILMHRDAWYAIKGHPEIPVHPMYLDGVTLYQAISKGFEAIEFPPQMPCYHIEHAGGWTPQENEKYFANLRNRGIPFVPKSLYARWAQTLSGGGSLPRWAENTVGWGFGEHQFPEEVILARSPSPHNGQHHETMRAN